MLNFLRILRGYPESVNGGDVVGRLIEVHATGGDLLYLRMLLIRRKVSTSFDELRTVEGHVFESFKEACAAMGLLQNDKIEKLLNDIGKSLKDFPTMPYPPEVFLYNSGNGLIAEEIGYDTEQMKRQHDENYIKLNREQNEVYEVVVKSVNSNKGEQFFVYGSGECEKIFVWQTLLCRLRSERKIVLPVASSGITAILLDGGSTTHSRFHIPIIVDQCSVAGIKHDTDLPELLKNTSLIIWDEAPMQYRHGIESVDKCLRDIMAPIDPSRSSRPFGGITVVFGGDYCQTLPNMRLYSGNSDERNKIIAEFAKFQFSIGDGKVHSITENPKDDGLVDFEIPEQFIIRGTDNPIQS
ncbi:uncharacterized protein LOC141665077 [Apium graveolens]|uniref:uncharacterized protein LOC141665077 n=1 Tax=Apium graveolens TaxID=4045 RepID=UPI003D7966D3